MDKLEIILTEAGEKDLQKAKEQGRREMAQEIMDIGNKWEWADVNSDELKSEIQRHLRKALLVGEMKP